MATDKPKGLKKSWLIHFQTFLLSSLISYRKKYWKIFPNKIIKNLKKHVFVNVIFISYHSVIIYIFQWPLYTPTKMAKQIVYASCTNPNLLAITSYGSYNTASHKCPPVGCSSPPCRRCTAASHWNIEKDTVYDYERQNPALQQRIHSTSFVSTATHKQCS